MLQQIINSHEAVHATPEPWFMLPLAYLLKEKTPGVRANYNYHFFKLNFRSFLENVDKEEVVLKKQIEQFAKGIYRQAIPTDSKATYFLDKTPRYFHIIKELLEIFPDEKIILLSRNPLHVFASIMQYNFKGNISWLSQQDRIADLLLAPVEILKYKDHPSTFFVNYEDLVNQPQEKVRLLFDYLNLEINQQLEKGEYEVAEVFKQSDFIDTKSAVKHKKPEAQYLNSWKKSIDDEQKKKLAKQYIQTLGKEVFESLGYSYEKVLAELDQHKVRFCIPTVSFNQLTGSLHGRIKSFLVALYRIQKRIFL